MKKFLLTLIVTMLTCIGAWAGTRSTDLLTPDEISYFNSTHSNIDKKWTKSDCAALNLKAGDELVITAKNPSEGYSNTYTMLFQYLNGSWADVKFAGIATYLGDEFVYDDFHEIKYVLTDEDIENIIDHNPEYATYALRFQCSANDGGFQLQSVQLRQSYTPVSSITVSGPTTVAVGGDIKLSESVLPVDATIKTVAWESSNDEIATVDADGNVHGVASGDVTIIAKATDGSGVVSEEYTVLVVKAIPATINVPSSVRYGETKDITVVVDGMTTDDYSISYDTDVNTYLTATGGTLTPSAVGGPTKVTVTITPSDEKMAEGYVASSFDYDVTVVKGEYTFTAAADPAFFVVGESGESTLSYSNVQLNGVDATTGFSVAYSPKASKDGVSLDGNTVTVASSATAGTFTAVATLTPTDETNYESATAEVDIIIGTPQITLNFGDQIIAKSAGTSNVNGYEKVTPEADFSNNTTFEFSAKSDNENIVTVAWDPSSVDQYTNSVNFTPISCGETYVTLTVKATNNSGKTTMGSEKIKVTVTNPLKFTVAEGNLKVNYDKPLTLDAIKSTVTKVYTGYDDNPTIVTSGYEIEVYNGDVKVTEDIPAEHTDGYTFTIKVKATNSEYSDALESKTKTVEITHLQSFDLALNADMTSILDNGQQAVITPAATYTVGETTTPVEISSYDMTYTLSAEGVATVEKDNTTNAITVTGQNPGTVTVTVTAHPTEGSTYATITNTTTITVTESQKVVLTKQTIDGKEYVVVHVPAGGAFGGISDTPKYTSTDGTNLDDLKAAANVKVTGSLSNSDIQELVHILSDATSATENYCESLDMGDVVLTEDLVATTAFEGTMPSISWINDNDYYTGLKMLESLVLPSTCTTNPVIPTGMCLFWNVNDTKFKNLTIPEGWTTIDDHAFSDASGNGVKGLQNLTLPNSIVTIGKHAFENAQIESLVLPRDLVYVDEYAFANLGQVKTITSNDKIFIDDKDVVIAAHAFEGASKLEHLETPENLVETKEYAFNNCSSLKELVLNNSLEKIGAYSFSDLHVQTLHMPKDIKYIGAYAFNAAPKLSDVYFYGDGKDLKYVDITAFSTQSQMCNNTVIDDDKNGQNNPTIDRSRYTNGGVLGCIMHFPEGSDKYYTDVTREYTIIDTSEESGKVYDKGNYVIVPHGTNADGTTYEWDATFQSAVNANVSTPYRIQTLTVDGAFPDETFGMNFIWPSQSQLESGYAIANAGYLWNTKPMEDWQYDPDNGIDRRGLYQFLTAMGNAPEDKKEWPFKYEQEKWYTICVPFNMTVDEIHNVFGPNTQVCRFDKVVRVETATEANNNTKKIYLEFRKNVLEAGSYTAADNIEYIRMEKGDGTTVPVYANEETTGIVHHVSYMIKPSGTVDENPSVRFDETTGERMFIGYKTIPGVLYKDKVTSTGGAERTYDFRGVTMKSDIVANTYVLSNKGADGKHIFGFYKGTLKNGVYVDGGTWNAYTAAVFPQDGADEYETFFKDIDPTIAHAPVYTFYIDDEEPTGIESYEIVCGNDPITDGKIYTVSGQRVNGINLTPGIYIKNGKKFIVK